MAAVSVVIPTWNHANFLGEAILSALSQQDVSTQVIVVDDGSTDDTEFVVREFGREVCYIWQPHRGLPAARNAGLERCQTQYVIFLDADDRLTSNAARIGLEYLATRPEWAFVSGEHRYINRVGQIAAEWTRPAVESNHYEHLLRNNYIGMVATVMFRRLDVAEARGFDTRLSACEDYDLYLRLAQKRPIGSHTNVVAEYRRYGSAMSDDPSRMLRAAVAVLSRQRALIGNDAQLHSALSEGLRHWRGYYGRPLAHRACKHLTNGRWADALRDTATVARHATRELVYLWTPGVG